MIMDKRDATLKQWRDRLAKNLRAFKRIKGRWPDAQIVEASKRAFTSAAEQGVKPPYIH